MAPRSLLDERIAAAFADDATSVEVAELVKEAEAALSRQARWLSRRAPRPTGSPRERTGHSSHCPKGGRTQPHPVRLPKGPGARQAGPLLRLPALRPTPVSRRLGPVVRVVSAALMFVSGVAHSCCVLRMMRSGGGDEDLP
jgi:hypothetical protein